MKSDVRLYSVVKGDCLSLIADKVGLPYDLLLKLNPQFGIQGFRNPDKVFTKEILVVGVGQPDGGTR